MSHIQNIDIKDLKEFLLKIETDQIICLADENVASLYKDLVSDISAIDKLTLFVTPQGEKCKTFGHFESYCEKILETGIYRGTHIVALGGGATSDFSGYLAASLLRGLSWSVIPTTLLSMIDAAIGGKVAINSKHGKNLVGSFHMPENIYICESFLTTLSTEDINSGLGELLKYGLLSNMIFDAVIKKEERGTVAGLCADFKDEVVKIDFKETGVRKNLNLGHTIGHAFEKHFKLPHGVAVMHGLYWEDELFNEGKLSKDLDRLRSSLNLPYTPLKISGEEIDPLCQLIFKDKKKVSLNSVEFVIAKEIEKIDYLKVTRDDFKRSFSSIIDKT